MRKKTARVFLDRQVVQRLKRPVAKGRVIELEPVRFASRRDDHCRRWIVRQVVSQCFDLRLGEFQLRISRAIFRAVASASAASAVASTTLKNGTSAAPCARPTIIMMV